MMVGSIVSPGCILDGTDSPMARNSGNGCPTTWTGTGRLRLLPVLASGKASVALARNQTKNLPPVPANPAGCDGSVNGLAELFDAILFQRRRFDVSQHNRPFQGFGSWRDQDLNHRVIGVGGACRRVQ